MARKRFSDEDVIRLLRQIEVETASGASVTEACRSAGVSDATYYAWRKKFGGMGPSKVKRMKELEKENQRLRKAVLFISEADFPYTVEIPVPIHEAREMKSKFKFAAIIQPRPPYTSWLEYEENADYSNATDDSSIHWDLEFPVIFADISCLAITDSNNKVLKIVRAVRAPLEHSKAVLAEPFKELVE